MTARHRSSGTLRALSHTVMSLRSNANTEILAADQLSVEKRQHAIRRVGWQMTGPRRARDHRCSVLITHCTCAHVITWLSASINHCAAARHTGLPSPADGRRPHKSPTIQESVFTQIPVCAIYVIQWLPLAPPILSFEFHRHTVSANVSYTVFVVIYLAFSIS